jgi:uncharacterized glyoxalase superfamily protein PhnB
MAGKPAPAVIPTLRYADAPAAIAWLTQACGFTEVMVAKGDDGTIGHAQLRLDDGMVMLASRSTGGSAEETEGEALGRTLGTAWIYVVVDDVKTHHDHAVEAGAEIAQALTAEDYGGSGYTARDPEGNLWSFGDYRPEI